MSEERRRIGDFIHEWYARDILAVLYTIGYLVMVGMLFLIEIPEDNEKPLLQLLGLMSAIQMSLVAYYYGSSKNAESSQQLIAESKERTDSVLREAVVPPIKQTRQPTVPAKDVTVQAEGDVTVESKP
jgi:hypothetical protein